MAEATNYEMTYVMTHLRPNPNMLARLDKLAARVKPENVTLTVDDLEEGELMWGVVITTTWHTLCHYDMKAIAAAVQTDPENMYVGWDPSNKGLVISFYVTSDAWEDRPTQWLDFYTQDELTPPDEGRPPHGGMEFELPDGDAVDPMNIC